MPIIRPGSLALALTVTLSLLPALPAPAQDQNVATPTVGMATTPATPSCDAIFAKISSGEALSTAENDQMPLCFGNPQIGQLVETPPGLVAKQPPKIYDMQDFLNIPGILSNNLVNG